MIGSVALRKKGNVGSPCVVVEKIDETFVMVDDGVKKQRCNIAHLDFEEKSVSSMDKIRDSLLSLGYQVPEVKQKRESQKKAASAPKAKRPSKEPKAKK